MKLGVNEQGQILAVDEIPVGLAVIEVEDDAFGGQDPTQLKSKLQNKRLIFFTEYEQGIAVDYCKSNNIEYEVFPNKKLDDIISVEKELLS